MLSVPAALLAVRLFPSSQDFLGYSGLAVVLLTLLISWVVGAVLGGFGIWRAEQPRLLAILGCLVNSLGIVWLLLR